MISPDALPLPVTVLIPTIGRAGLLRSCLESVARCRPPAAEILVVDQSEGSEVSAVVGEYTEAGARSVRSEPRGVATARNAGLRSATHEIVAFTDDDCTVAEDWVRRAWRHALDEPRGMVTGRVLPVGDPALVPSTKVDTESRTFTSSDYGVLFSNNMVGRRAEMLAFGGFDERMRLTASDNEFCYRWLRAGRPLRFEPDLVVFHHAWRTPGELEHLYVRYAVGQGMLFAKFLLQGDRRILPHLAWDLRQGLHGLAARIRHGKPQVPDYPFAIPRGLPRGLWLGFRTFGPGARS